MKFEVLKKSHLKRNIIIGVVVVVIIAAIVISFTRAKYRTAQSMPLINGTVNYSLADLNIVAIYVGGVEVDSLDSSKQYTLDTTQSYCTNKDGSRIEGLYISYDTETGSLSISPFTAKGTKCTLYFDEIKESIIQDILSNYPTVLTRANFSTTITNTTTGTIYKSLDSSQYDDNDDEVYYFAGNPTDNWVKFAGFYWRIIRINGDGSIRLIYQGKNTSDNGQIGIISFNAYPNYDKSEHVGLKYTNGSQHGAETNSTIMETLNTWHYNNLRNYVINIDTGVGFCSDRDMTSGNNWSSQPNNSIYYATYGRIAIYATPSLDCSAEDVLSVDNGRLDNPIGLITADEVAYAGGVYGNSNNSYYLYTGENYWTMSPYNYLGSASVFIAYLNGNLGSGYVYDTFGIRPVINLKADTLFEAGGEGTSSKPYVVV